MTNATTVYVAAVAPPRSVDIVTATMDAMKRSVILVVDKSVDFDDGGKQTEKTGTFKKRFSSFLFLLLVLMQYMPNPRYREFWSNVALVLKWGAVS